MQRNILIEILSAINLIILIILPCWYFAELPDTIPIHYGADGKADGYGTKYTIFLLPLIGTVIFIGLTILNRYPHLFNYPHTITADNKEKSYRTAQAMISTLKLLITLIFLYILYRTILITSESAVGLSALFVPFTFFVITAVVTYYILQLLKR
jgi:uncharacterized membrane protein